MSYGEFQERWDDEAYSERKRYDVRPVSELIADIRAGRFGDYYQIWYSLGARASIAEAAPLLFEILESPADYLVRYHCAAALISILDVHAKGYQPVNLSARGKEKVAENLATLRIKLLAT